MAPGRESAAPPPPPAPPTIPVVLLYSIFKIYYQNFCLLQNCKCSYDVVYSLRSTYRPALCLLLVVIFVNIIALMKSQFYKVLTFVVRVGSTPNPSPPSACTVLPNTDNGTCMKPTESLIKCPSSWRYLRRSAELRQSARKWAASRPPRARGGATPSSKLLAALRPPSKSRPLTGSPPACVFSSATACERWTAASLPPHCYLRY